MPSTMPNGLAGKNKSVGKSAPMSAGLGCVTPKNLLLLLNLPPSILYNELFFLILMKFPGSSAGRAGGCAKRSFPEKSGLKNRVNSGKPKSKDMVILSEVR